MLAREDANVYKKDWVDILKCFSIFIVVLGHCGLDLKEYFQPRSLEALGVAPFFFLLGYNLILSRKKKLNILISRLFGLYLWGLSAAFLQSFLNMWLHGNFVESNFLPFIFGINSFFPNAAVPGNPVLWFVGAYTHFVLLFLVFRTFPLIGTKTILTAMLVEILIRLGSGTIYNSYTFFLNWISIFLMGVYVAQNETTLMAGIKNNRLIIILLAVITILVISIANKILPAVSEGLRYVCVTALLFGISCILRSGKVVRFIAQNTLIVFLFHHIIIHFMPYGLPVVVIFIEAITLTLSLAFVSRYITNLKPILALQNRIINHLDSPSSHPWPNNRPM